jgi:hypothetical protein
MVVDESVLRLIMRECDKHATKEHQFGIAAGAVGLIASGVASFAISPYFLGSVLWCGAYLCALHSATKHAANAMFLNNLLNMVGSLLAFTNNFVKESKHETPMDKVQP